MRGSDSNPALRIAGPPLRALAALAFSATAAASGAGEKTGADPSINAMFYAADPAAFEARWEKAGREVFDRREAIVAACRLKPGMAVADIGAGTGLFTRLFAEAVGPAGRVFAADISGPFVDHILRRAEVEGMRNIKGIRCLPEDAGLPEGSADFVFLCNTYHHLEAPEKTLRSILKGMKPGAELLVIDFKREEGRASEWVLGHVRAGEETVRGEIEAAGFEFVEALPLLEENFVLRFRHPGR